MQHRTSLLKPGIQGAAEPPARNLASIAFDRIRRDIVFGTLRPGERLRINSLSERYGVGATAIREALSRLVTDEMVMSEDNRGFCVSSLSRDDMLDLTQTRVDVEGLTLSRAIELGDVEWETRVMSAYHRLSKCPPPANGDLAAQMVWADTHFDFHASLLSGCNSTWLMRLCKVLYDRSERYRNIAEKSSVAIMRDVITEHTQLKDAVLARDAPLAVQLLSAHFWETTNVMLQNEFDGDRRK